LSWSRLVWLGVVDVRVVGCVAGVKVLVFRTLFTFFFFFFNDAAPTGIYTLSLHDALPISNGLTHLVNRFNRRLPTEAATRVAARSEEHTSELQSPYDLVCRLLLEKKKKVQLVIAGGDEALVSLEPHGPARRGARYADALLA